MKKLKQDEMADEIINAISLMPKYYIQLYFIPFHGISFQ